MDIAFNLLEIENFCRIRDNQVIDFDAMGPGVHYVRGINSVIKSLGSNGASKSSIWNAMSWCLFGKTISGLRTPDIKPRGTRLVPCVRLTMTRKLPGKKPRTLIIQRVGKTNGLTIDGKHVDGVDAFIPLSWDAFQHALILGQGRPLFFDLKAQGKMELFSELLDLDRWERASKRARQQTHDLNSTLAAHNQSISQKVNLIQGLKDRITDTRQKYSDWNDDYEKHRSRITERRAKIRALLEKRQAAFKDADARFDFAELELRDCRKQISAFRAEADKGQKVYYDIKSSHDRQVDARDALRKELTIKGNTCPTCGSSLKGTNLEKHRISVNKKITELEKAITKSARALDDAETVFSNIKKKALGYQTAERDFITKSNNASDDRAAASRQINELNEQLAGCHVDEDAVNPFTHVLAELKRQKSQHLVNLQDEKAKATNISIEIDHASYWIGGFQQIKLHMVQETLEELSAVCQTLLADVGLAGWQIEFAIERELKKGTADGLDVRIREPGSDLAVKWESWSGGEAQRLRLVGAVALSDVLLRRAGINIGFMVLDEPTRGLSAQGIDDTVDFLCDYAESRQIFYVDHHTVESNRFASILRVHRQKGGVRISREK